MMGYVYPDNSDQKMTRLELAGRDLDIREIRVVRTIFVLNLSRTSVF